MSGPDRATLAVKANHNLKPIHDLNTPTHSPTKHNARVYRLQPTQGPALTVAVPVCTEVNPLTPARASWPAPQPLHPTQWPTPPPGKSVIKVGLDIDLKQSAAGHVVYTVPPHPNPLPWGEGVTLSVSGRCAGGPLCYWLPNDSPSP